MINKLKKKFVILASVSMFIFMTVLVLVMNFVNYASVVSDVDMILDVLSQPAFPIQINEKPDTPSAMFDFIPPGMSPEVPYESRYFVAEISKEGEIVNSNLSNIISVDEESAEDYIDSAFAAKHDRGFVGQFRYYKMNFDGNVRIVFLDCGRKLESFKSFYVTSIAVGLAGCILISLFFILAAGRIVKPIAESYEKQKRFISDAGHEIKTPLTIINANVELLELDGEKEELSDIKQQTERLTKLTNNLVYLSKMEENEHSFQMVDMPFSDIVSETVGAFGAVALAHNIEISKNITPGLSINGSPDAVRQLVSILLENSIKYSPDGASISIDLSAQKKKVQLTVKNSVKEPVRESDLDYVFDRFYRADSSRNSETGGHGIGLSISKAIVESHGGTISASTKTGNEFIINAQFPQNTIS